MKPEFEKLNLFEIAALAWGKLMQFENWGSWLGLVVLTFVFISVAYAAIQLVIKFLEALGDVVESAERIGVKIPFSRPKDPSLTQRQQFCDVLRIDLEQVAQFENWMEQWFTDLEAEVEVEGRFYASRLHRLLNLKNKGNWREPSLMRAIAKSSEPRLLLVGEPGGGKSVALRHLALELAKEGTKSRAPRIRIPLYVNLREFNIDSGKEVTAQAIGEFVCGYFRSTESQTGRYVRQHWDEFLEQGVWYFLFDSFDEIPAVMHAERGSRTIQNYAEAIHNFMTDMTKCRGILASREFKGPESMPWPKLRILPLDNARQLRLVDNTALSRAQSAIVHDQLAAPYSAMYRNPLLLSLLCRYIKEHGRGPKHNHALLINHLTELSEREDDHVLKEYGLSPKNLLNGAEEIASILAQQSNMGLAPTFGELADALAIYGHEREDAIDLLKALIYVKIGRNDVKEARRLERRFAFSHRRYQETLFVQYLVKNANLIAPNELLLDTRWREYTVTLLQSQDMKICHSLLTHATNLLSNWSRTEAIPVNADFSQNSEMYSYFPWHTTKEVHLLTLLQEGLIQRIDEIPANLSDAIESFVAMRWSVGDSYDQLMAMQLGGLSSQEKLEFRIQQTVKTHSYKMKRAAFEKISFLKTIPDALAEWIRMQIADETMVAIDRIELSKFDLLASRLPSSIGAQRIFDRCKFLREAMYRPVKWIVDAQIKFTRYVDNNLGTRPRNETDSRVGIVILNAVMFGPITCATLSTICLISVVNHRTWLAFLSGTLLFIVLSILCKLIWRDSRSLISPVMIASAFFLTTLSGIRSLLSWKVLLFVTATLAVPAILITLFWQFNVAAPLIVIALGLVAMPAMLLQQINRKKRSLQHLAKLTHAQPTRPLILEARDTFELTLWVAQSSKLVLQDTSNARSVLRLLDYLPFSDEAAKTLPPFFSIQSRDNFSKEKDLILDFLFKSDNVGSDRRSENVEHQCIAIADMSLHE